MLAYVAGSVSTDLNVWERMACPCVSQAVCLPFSNYCVSSLAAGFRFHLYSMCIPWPLEFLILDVVQTRSLLDWSHAGRVRFFTFMFCINIGIGGRGELIESNSSFGKYYASGDWWLLPPQCQHDIEKKRCMIFDYGMMTHEEASENIMILETNDCISFGFGQFVSLSTEAIFSFNFWEAPSIVSLGEAKMASFLRSNFGFEFGAKVCLFWSLWQVIPDWLVLEATGCEQRELSLLCCGSTSTIPAAKLWNNPYPCHRLLHDGVSMNWHMLPSRLQDDATEQCQHDIEKNGVWSLIMAWWRMKRVSRFAGWRMELYADIHLGCASICRRVGGHIHWEIFLLVPRHFFWVWTVCVSFDGSHF